MRRYLCPLYSLSFACFLADGGRTVGSRRTQRRQSADKPVGKRRFAGRQTADCRPSDCGQTIGKTALCRRPDGGLPALCRRTKRLQGALNSRWWLYQQSDWILCYHEWHEFHEPVVGRSRFVKRMVHRRIIIREIRVIRG